MTELEKAENVGVQLLSPGSGRGRGTGIEPSPRRPTWKKVAQRMAPVTAAQSRGRLEAEAQKGRQPALPWGPNTAPVSDCVHPENHEASSFRPPLLVIAEDRAAYANHQKRRPRSMHAQSAEPKATQQTRKTAGTVR